MNKQIIKDALILTCITLIAGILLGLVYDVTKQPIARQRELTKQKACKTVFADADTFDTEHTFDIGDWDLPDEYEGCSIDEAIPALGKDGGLLGYVLTVTCSEGYGGDITIMMGVTVSGTLNGIEFLSISETAGLGMEAKKPKFKDQFQDKQAQQFTVTKDEAHDENEIEAVSSATITSKAVTKAVNAGLDYVTFLTATRSNYSKGGAGNE